MVSFMLKLLRVLQSNKPGLAAQPGIKRCMAVGGGRQGTAASPATAENKKEGQFALAEGIIFDSISVTCKYRQNQCQRTDFKHSCRFNSLAQPVC